MKPTALLSMAKKAVGMRRSRALKKMAEVDAIRTLHGVPDAAPIGPVLREELWQARYMGAGLGLLMLAERQRAIAEDEGVSVEEVAERYQTQTIRPHRQRAGERLSDLILTDGRPDWVDPEHLVRMVEPLDNGTPSPAYVRIVSDLDGTEMVHVSSFDGSEPMAWQHNAAGLKAAASEALNRVRAAASSDAYAAWEAELNEGTGTNPFTQSMSEADFLATDAVHLV